MLGALLGGLLVLSPALAHADEILSPSDAPADVATDAPDIVSGVEVAAVQVGRHCAPWSDSSCLIADASFDADLRALGSTAIGRSLLADATRAGVTIVRLDASNAPPAASVSMGAFLPAQNTVRVAATVLEYPQPDRLAILTHELQHAVDAADGLPIGTATGCYRTEEHAVTTEVELWGELFGGALPAPRTPYEAWLNTATRSAGDLAGVIQTAYRSECARLAPPA